MFLESIMYDQPKKYALYIEIRTLVITYAKSSKTQGRLIIF
jgi:hypothetical protein